MPIYAYKCSSCQHELDALQKISDPPMVVCPACGAATLSKQLTAAGFQLKGSGWYATDFKNAPAKTDGKPEAKPAEAPAAGAASEPAKESAKESAAASSTPAKDTPAACGTGGCAACS